jgi:hypothetical protein
MYAVLRSTTGNKANETARLLEQNKAEMEKLLRSVRGFVSYSLVRTDDGTVSMSVFQDKANADESSRVVLDWIKKNAPALEPPVMSQGPVLISIGPISIGPI